jgi:hypothetical protein
MWLAGSVTVAVGVLSFSTNSQRAIMPVRAFSEVREVTERT